MAANSNWIFKPQVIHSHTLSHQADTATYNTRATSLSGGSTADCSATCCFLLSVPVGHPSNVGRQKETIYATATPCYIIRRTSNYNLLPASRCPGSLTTRSKLTSNTSLQ